MSRPKPQIAEVPLALLAGGKATRLASVTADQTPKAMVDVAGKPFIDHQMELFYRRGIRRVVLCLGHLGKAIESHVGDGSQFGLKVSYSHDGPGLLGTGGAIRRALPMLGDLFWVVYGDSYVDIDFAAVLEAFLNSDHRASNRNLPSPATGKTEMETSTLALMTVLANDDQWDKSNVEFVDGQLVRYDKRNRTPSMHHVDYGVGLLRKSAAERIPPAHPHDLADLYSELVARRQMMGFEVTRRFYEIGTPAALAETREYLQSLRNRDSNE